MSKNISMEKTIAEINGLMENESNAEALRAYAKVLGKLASIAELAQETKTPVVGEVVYIPCQKLRGKDERNYYHPMVDSRPWDLDSIRNGKCVSVADIVAGQEQYGCYGLVLVPVSQQLLDELNDTYQSFMETLINALEQVGVAAKTPIEVADYIAKLVNDNNGCLGQALVAASEDEGPKEYVVSDPPKEGYEQPEPDEDDCYDDDDGYDDDYYDDDEDEDYDEDE